MNEPHGKVYTAKNIRIELLLLQRHLSDYIQEMEEKRAKGLPVEPDTETDFCLECVEQHLLALEGFCREALSFFEDASLFATIGKWASNTGEGLNGFDEAMARKMRSEGREHRKDVTAKTSECQPCKRLAERFAQQVEPQTHVMRGSAL